MSRPRLPLLAFVACALLLCVVPASGVAKDGDRPAHVVLVILGGGVRASDMLDAERMPTLAAMAKAGRVVGEVRSDAAHAYDGAARLLTGRGDALAGPATRPSAPTLMEALRVGRGLAREKVWFVSYEGGEQLRLAHSTSADHGAAAGPATASGFGAFGEPLAAFLERTGRPDPVPDAAWPLLRRLRTLNRSTVALDLPEGGVEIGTPRAERVERALLREIDRRSLLVRGPNPRDERAWRAALTVLHVHRPALLVIRLGEAEVASRSLREYERVLTANDRGLARLRAAIEADAELAGRTLVCVVPDHGRDAAPGAAGGLGASDGSAAHREVALVAEGPGIRRKGGRLEAPSTLDVAPTLARLLGVELDGAAGRPWTSILE